MQRTRTGVWYNIRMERVDLNSEEFKHFVKRMRQLYPSFAAEDFKFEDRCREVDVRRCIDKCKEKKLRKEKSPRKEKANPIETTIEPIYIEPTYGVKEVADQLGVGDYTVRDYIKRGLLEAEKVGRGYCIKENAIEEFKTRKKPKKRAHRASKEIIERIKARDSFRCTLCGKGEHLEVHHIKYRSEGGDDSDNNLITLCRRCHALQHEGEPVYKLMAKNVPDL